LNEEEIGEVRMLVEEGMETWELAIMYCVGSRTIENLREEVEYRGVREIPKIDTDRFFVD